MAPSGRTASRKKPGPKGLLTNPRPIEQWVTDDDGSEVCTGKTEEIEPSELNYAERVLCKYFRERREELVARQGEAERAAVWRITRLATDALSETNVGWWSGYGIFRALDNPEFLKRRLSRPWGRGGSRRHVGPKPPPKVEHKSLWLDTSAMPATLKRYNKHSRSWHSMSFSVDKSIAANQIVAEKFIADMTRLMSWLPHTSWPSPTLALRDPITRMLRGRSQMGRAGKSGRPAYLAYATLGALLDTKPEKIADFLNNYRR